MKQKKGSITVEGVFIIPLVMMILLLFLWLSLYMHDRVAARGTMQQVISSAGDYLVYGTLPESGYLSKRKTIDRGILYAISDSALVEEERLENYFRLLLSDQLFLYQLKSVDFQKKGCYLTLKAEFYCPGSVPAALLLQKDSFHVIYEEKCFWAVKEEITRAGSALLQLLERADD